VTRSSCFTCPSPSASARPAGVTDHTLTVTQRAEDFYVALPEAPVTVRVDPELTVLARLKFTPPAAMIQAQLTNQTT